MIAISLAAAFGTALIADANTTTAVSAQEFKQMVEPYDFISKNPGLKFVRGEKRDKFAQILMEAPNGQRFEIVVIPGSKFLVVGRVFDKTGQSVNLPADMNVVKSGVAFTVGKGPKELYLVTDPQCPYCQRLEEQLEKNPAVTEEFSIHIIPLPLSFHKNARPMFYYILSGKTDEEKAKRMKEVMVERSDAWQKAKISEEDKRKMEAIIAKGEEAAKELGARGTPAMFDASGKQIDPYAIANYKPKEKGAMPPMPEIKKPDHVQAGSK